VGGSLSGSKSSSKSQSSYKDEIYGTQDPYLGGMYQGAQDLFNQTSQGMSQYIPGAAQNMQGIFQGSQPYWQNQMQGGAYKDMNLQNQLLGSLQQSEGRPSAQSEINAMIMGGDGNNYADAMKDQYMQDAQRSMDNMNSTLDARAAGSGMGGSSRHGVAQGIMGRGINDKLQKNLAETGYNTFDKDLQRKLQIAGQADQNNFGRQQMMSNMIGQQQGAMQGGLNFGQNMQNMNMGQFSPYMAPWQAMGQYSNAIGRPTVLGSGQGTSKGSSSALSASAYINPTMGMGG